MVTYALTSGLASQGLPDHRLRRSMFFGLGSEIAGVAVTRSIAKWFKEGEHGLRHGSSAGHRETWNGLRSGGVAYARRRESRRTDIFIDLKLARPAFLGLALMMAGMVLWAVFVAMDARFDRQAGLKDTVDTAEEDKFRFLDVVELAEKQAVHRHSPAVCVLLQRRDLLQEVRFRHPHPTF